MKLEFSAGGVVFNNQDNEKKIILCLQKKFSGSKVYCLPKGHIEQEESKESAALREVLEETGIKAKIIAPVFPIVYTFRQKNQQIRKKVDFFLMKCISQNFTPNYETENIIWCDLKTALKLNPYKSEKEIIVRAFELIESQETDKKE